MCNPKRVTIATLSGLLFGFVCYGLASSGGTELPTAIALQLITSRTLMGLAIGVSCMKLAHWSIHGLVMGLLFSLPLALSGMMADNPEYSKEMLFVMTVAIGMVYGLLTELITSVIFKAKI